MILAQEFHADHQKVVAALFELRQAIAAADIQRVRSILEQAEGLIGPQALRQFRGQAQSQTFLRT